ncbi:MAG: class A beta-lactamase-related serine hydrolase [Candidatus Pacebacteria bacterium]|nr:class A beta-lactamase-related serine hydrolase [Candidatus Paceibacterota bacterium]
MQSKFFKIALPIGFVLIGLVAGYFLHNTVSGQNTSGPGLRENDPQYPLTQPLLLCSEKSSFYEYTPLADKIKNYIDQKKKDGSVSDISYYFKDLNSGQWTGVNENDRYSPASLLKVAVMFAYLKLTEQDPSILAKGVLYDTKENLNQSEYFSATTTLKQGASYTFASLIQTMIENSDNNALAVLENFIDQKSLNEVYTDLGLPLPPSQDSTSTIDYISTKLYSHFFRVLYNATYLDRDLSEKALEILSQTNFKQGIAAGVPAGTKVADKFGERTAETANGVVDFRELHDCGIVYMTGNPYTICIMTKGKSDFNTLSNIIKDISAITYTEVSVGIDKTTK